MLPGSQLPGYTTGVTAPLGSDQPIGADIQFSIPLDFNGSEGIFFAPFGVQSTALITWYCRFFLGGGVRTLMIGAGLTGVYTFLYITLRQQDYALLMGAIALFIVLTIVMYVTRKVDWYARDAS